MWLCKGTIVYQSKLSKITFTIPIEFTADQFDNIEDKMEKLQNLAFANVPDGFTTKAISLDSQTRIRKGK